jgi:nucleotide-binding universal stress UspA family protein
MTGYRRILLASHGTDGARAAERLVLRLARPGAVLHHLLVVPEFWKGMMGDDWLNNAATRDIYADYLETALEREARATRRRVQGACARRRLRYRPEVVQGVPTDCLIRSAQRARAELVVIGSPRPRGRSGLRSRVELDALTRALRVPLLIAPVPR